MTRFIALKDGYLSDACIFVKQGQVIEFPAGKEPKVDPENKFEWLVPEKSYKPEAELPVVSATPVVSEAKPKAHEIETVRPEYDQQTDLIIAGENVRDGVISTEQAAVIVAGDVEETGETEEPQSTGDQDVLG